MGLTGESTHKPKQRERSGRCPIGTDASSSFHMRLGASMLPRFQQPLACAGVAQPCSERKVGDRSILIASPQPQLPTSKKRASVRRRKAQLMVKVGHGPLGIAAFTPCLCAVSPGEKVVSIDAEGFVEVRQGAVWVAGPDLHASTTGPTSGAAGVELNGFCVGVEGLLPVLPGEGFVSLLLQLGRLLLGRLRHDDLLHLHHRLCSGLRNFIFR
mmetsp:Transcript_16100/g.46070  ORF Transcript_16100/g.46070 Transcript_16100/m.46070 type:complete len:213 (-) Transcript_16100:267-905(-)